jgi:hypothetical protein
MKLSDLFLNRFLYRDNNQNLETKGADFASLDSMDTEPASIPSGGAAQDINTGNVTINGQQLTPGTYPVTTLDVSNWGWGQTCAFSSTDLNTVSWGIGVFTSASGVSYNISAGNTGNMAAKTYIYLDLLVSETAYQITTTPANAVGVGKVLVAVANPDAVSATYNLSEATQIVGDNILANSINASKITTGQLIVGTNVGLGTAQDSGGVTTIIGNTVTTGYVSALGLAVGSGVALGTAFAAADAGDLAYEDLVGAALLDSTVISGGYIITSLLTADNIIAGTLTGRTVQTSSSGIRTVLDSSDDKIKFMSGSTVWGFILPQAFGTLNGFYIAAGNEDAWIRIVEGDHHLVSMRNSDGAYVSVYDDSVLISAGDIGVSGDLSTGDIYAADVYCSHLIVETVGYVYSDASEGTPFPSPTGWSVDHTATGRYRVNHPLNTYSYTVIITPVAAAAKIWCIATRDDDYFDVRIGDASGTLEDNDFMFHVLQNQ